MKRILLRHLSGSKASQTEEFPLSHFSELLIGRDPSSTVKYDPDKDDLVGRRHAKLTADPASPNEFIITDLDSRNGTFLNKQKIVGSVRIGAGDVVQFGAGGPEFVFDLEPRAESVPRQTRVGDISAIATLIPPPATRAGEPLPGAAPQTDNAPQASAPGMPVFRSGGASEAKVGRATVERMITDVQRKSRRQMILGSSVLAALMLAGGAGLAFFKPKPAGGTVVAPPSPTPKTTLEPAEVAQKYERSVVQIEVAWKLVSVDTGEQIYHRYVLNRDPETGQPLVPNAPAALPTFVQVQSKTGQPVLEPALDLEKIPSRAQEPIGAAGFGTGFVVTSDGNILTNAHVATAWKTSYQFRSRMGVLVQKLRGEYVPLINQQGQPVLVQSPRNWVPSETLQAGLGLEQKSGGGLEGVNTVLNAVFPNSITRFAAVGKPLPSDRHDVAIFKINVPGEPLVACELNDNYETARVGDKLTVLGFPGITPAQFGVVFSQDAFNRTYQAKSVPNATLSTGNIGSIVRDQSVLSGKTPIMGSFGDYYQLTVNSTGGGNSGGPVFDEQGKVIGIFTAGAWEPGAAITFAVPIRYGKELMGIPTLR
jgi:S1-C subfamily serine protease